MVGIQFGLQTGYNAPITQVKNKFPGFSDADIKKLEEKTKDIVDPIEKAKIQNEIYRKVLPIVQQQQQLQARDEGLNNLAYQKEQEKDTQKKSVINVGVKMGELGNAIKTKFNLPANAPDDSIIQQFIEQTDNGEQMLMDYINGKSDELLYVSGLRDRPEREKTPIKDIGEGLVSFAGGLPKVIAETGLLDKQAKVIGGGIANIIRKIQGKEVLTDEEIGSFSDFVSGSQVGGDTESPIAKGVEYGADALAMLSGVPAIAKSVGKQVAKQSLKKSAKVIGEIIAEPETTKTVQKALKEKRLVEGTQGRIKRQLFGEKGAEIMPTKQIDEAVDIITKNIDKPSKTPSGLFNQLTDYIENKSKALSTELKKIKIDKTWDKAEIKLNLKELASNTEEFTTAEIKKIEQFSKRINKIKNLDELWTLRKEFDDMFSDAIKQASDISAPATRRANKIRKSTRNIFNNKINEISDSIGTVSTKQEFKDMSAILNAKSNIIEKSGIKMLKPTQGLISKKNIVRVGAGILGYKALGGLGN